MSKLMRMVLSSAVLSLGCWAQTPGSAQQERSQGNPPQVQQGLMAAGKEPQPKSSLHLTIVETIHAKEEIATGFAEFTCDEDGNIFLGAEAAGAAIRKLNSKGELVATFDRYANPDIQVYGAGSYTLDVDGELYSWVGNPKDGYVYVLGFGADGKYKTKIKIDPGFPWVPGPFAIFRNGTLLMTGQEYDRDVKRPMLPFTGIFRSDGKLLKELSLEDDERIHAMAKEHDPKLTSAAVPTSNRAVAWGRVQPAKDGNIYVMRWLSPTVFYVVSPGGEIVRRFTVDPGTAGLMPVTMHITGNRIAILFRNDGTREQQMKIVDLNGEELATYDATSRDPNNPLGAAFACYFAKSEQFTFLTTDEDHRVVLRTLEPR
jgi:hypothetical protein